MKYLPGRVWAVGRRLMTGDGEVMASSGRYNLQLSSA